MRKKRKFLPPSRNIKPAVPSLLNQKRSHNFRIDSIRSFPSLPFPSLSTTNPIMNSAGASRFMQQIVLLGLMLLGCAQGMYRTSAIPISCFTRTSGSKSLPSRVESLASCSLFLNCCIERLHPLCSRPCCIEPCRYRCDYCIDSCQ
jgi:hypothetical protein